MVRSASYLCFINILIMIYKSIVSLIILSYLPMYVTHLVFHYKILMCIWYCCEVFFVRSVLKPEPVAGSAWWPCLCKAPPGSSKSGRLPTRRTFSPKVHLTMNNLVLFAMKPSCLHGCSLRLPPQVGRPQPGRERGALERGRGGAVAHQAPPGPRVAHQDLGRHWQVPTFFRLIFI